MFRLLITSLFFISSVLNAEEMTVEKFKTIVKGKETETVRKELQVFPLFKKSRVKLDLSSPNKDDVTLFLQAQQKYIEGKYTLTAYLMPDGKKRSSITLWNKKNKVIESWSLSDENKLNKTLITKSKKKGRYLSSGKSKDGTFEGYTDYSAKLISWETKYYDKEGKLRFSVSGNAVPIK